METKALYETAKCRCLNFYRKQSEDLYLITCGTQQTEPDHYFHAKERKGFHLHVIMSGKGILCIEGKEQILQAGQMFVTKQGEDTWYRPIKMDPWCYCWMAFDGNKAAELMEAAGFVKGVNVLDCAVDPYKLYQTIHQILDCPEMTLSNDLMHLGKLYEFISLAVCSHEKRSNIRRGRENLNSSDYVRFAREYMRYNYATINVEDVANYIGINRSYLTKIFKEELGESPQQYIMNCKMNHACRLLVETNVSIQKIAETIGYDNALSFTKIFKNWFKMSPSEYRKNTPEKTDLI